MNRSILIVIADFLLVSLLAFSSFDANRLMADRHPGKIKLDLKPEMKSTDLGDKQEMAGVLQLALEDERRSREMLVGELNQTRDALRARQDLLTEREKQIQGFQQNLQSKDQQTRQLEQDKAALQEQFANSQTNAQHLQQQLKATSNQALMTKEQLAEMQERLRKQQEAAAALQKQLAELEKSRQAAQAEKEQLATQLEVAQAEKRAAGEQVAKMQAEVLVEREEKARLTAHADKLAEGVKTLANKSGELAEGIETLAAKSTELKQEIRENRALTPNTIFYEFTTNRVHARFYAYRSGLLGIDINKREETDTILVSNGTNIFALCHIEDTPLSLGNPGTDWEGVTGTLTRGSALVSIPSMQFYLLDPRVILIPVTEPQARQLGSKIYRISANPFKFQDAVLVGAREGYYGECKFQIDLTAPQYVKMDRSFVRGLFGKFNPSRGDLVFNETGELLGVMVNNHFCVMLNGFPSAAAIQFGQNVRAENTGDTLSRLYNLVARLPMKLH